MIARGWFPIDLATKDARAHPFPPPMGSDAAVIPWDRPSFTTRVRIRRVDDPPFRRPRPEGIDGRLRRKCDPSCHTRSFRVEAVEKTERFEILVAKFHPRKSQKVSGMWWNGLGVASPSNGLEEREREGDEGAETQMFEWYNDVRNDESGHPGAVVESENVALVSFAKACSCKDDLHRQQA